MTATFFSQSYFAPGAFTPRYWGPLGAAVGQPSSISPASGISRGIDLYYIVNLSQASNIEDNGDELP